MKSLKIATISATALCLSGPALADDWQTGTDEAAVLEVLKASFTERSEVKLDRLQQSEMQKVCSDAERAGTELPKDVVEKITAAAQESVKFPADGEFLGDWRQGEKIAQSGRGLQWSDKPGAARGGNCYACHEMSKAEISFGNIRSEEHTSELQSRFDLVCRLLLEKKKTQYI